MTEGQPIKTTLKSWKRVYDEVIYGENDYIEKVNNYLFKVNINSRCFAKTIRL